MKKKTGLLTLAAFALVVIFGLAGSVQAAPVPPAGTPAESKSATPKIVTYASSRVFTQDTTLDAAVVSGYGLMDVQYVVVGAGGLNTVTLTLLHSNDASRWVTGTALFGPATAAANTTDMARAHLFGAFTTVFVDVTNATPITLTVNGLAR